MLINGTCNCIANYYPMNGAGCYNCSTSCQCQGYYMTNGVCHTICGDKVIINEFEQCDDGNFIDGDGCSSSCTVEKDFKCVNIISYSSCSYTGVLDIKLISWEKNSYCNCLTFVLDISPKLATLQYLDFNNIVIPNLPLNNATYTFKDGVLTLAYEFNTSLDRENLSFLIAPESNINYT